jgi:putative phosphoribosyl transferase
MTTHVPCFKKFGTREEAGHALAKRLSPHLSSPDTVVLGLPKGGVAVGAEIARCLNLPFDILLLSRITVPGCGETPLGALTSGGVRVLNCAMIDRLHLTEEEVRGAVLAKSIRLARRERTYRPRRPSMEVADRRVILVDDGTTECAVIRDAIHLLRRQHAEHVLVALPAACHHSACDMRMEADEVVTLAEPSGEFPASRWFEQHAPPSSDEIRRILESLPEPEESMI